MPKFKRKLKQFYNQHATTCKEITRHNIGKVKIDTKGVGNTTNRTLGKKTVEHHEHLFVQTPVFRNMCFFTIPTIVGMT